VEEILASATVRIGDLFQETSTAIDFDTTQTEILHEQLPRFPREVDVARSRGDRVYLVAPEDHLPKMSELLHEQELDLGPAGVELVRGELQRGFRLPHAAVTIFGERQLLRKTPLLKHRGKKARYGPFLASLRDLKIGDYVVHADHGIGQFIALRNLGGDTNGQSHLPPELTAAAPEGRGGVEVMEISYATGKTLLLPLSRLDQVQKYSGIEGLAPRLDRLGGTSWKKTRQRIKAGMRDMAEELLKLYAERQMALAPMISPSGNMLRDFELAFEFDETSDQLDAIQDIYNDLENERPMDRLLCGDVGFGKTEVAMRAAFRVVEGNYQVAVLAPTTILADQHLETFRRRFKNFPINIEMISRFRSAAEVRDIQKRTEEGKVDILIGTHRLLSRKVQLPKLGLLIIDEEQRFGVSHKERLKKLRKDVHVLAMSATPVPRTLQLSLAGVRDLSLIETPPRDRMAVETAILPFDAAFIREAVEFEIERQGQVYYVHNQVETIDSMAGYLKEIIPGLKVTVGHGQLDEKELWKRMHAFVAGEYHMLLATTIIENGIDIPNVNTMIVHRADRFGLSQLYQLRGRVGRSDRLAYCYLLVPPDRTLSADARKRLQAIREFTELGAGFRVAGRDLEIRGAGNLLGGEQSGHIASVGIDIYLKMLEETVAELKGEMPEETPSVALDLPVAMSIPESYVGDANLRMEIYRRLATGEENEEDLLTELRDRFGPPPKGVNTLLQVAAVKRLAEALHLQAISARGDKLVLRLRQDARVEPERLIELISKFPNSRFSPSGALTLSGVGSGEVVSTARQVLEFLSFSGDDA
jgi:transcription-repair coupling factor (superfamily II helicase)